MQRFSFYLAVIILLFSQATCRPGELASVTTSPTVTATTALPATPLHTQTPLPPTTTRTPINTPPPTPPSSATPWPTETPYPTAPPSTNTLSPEPTLSVYEDVEIYAYIMNETWFQAGAYDERLPGYPLNATYSTTDEPLAAELKSLIEGDIFVLLTGDYYPASDGNGHLVVEKFEYVQQLYTSETPFDAVFQSPQFNFSFRYPANWSVETQSGDGGVPSVRIFNAPFDSILLRPGREAYDPTAFDVSLRFEPITVDAYISGQQEAAKADESDDWPTTVTVAYLEMGGQMVVQVTHVSWYRSVNYAVPWVDGIVIITPSMGSGSLDNMDFIRRLVESIA